MATQNETTSQTANAPKRTGGVVFNGIVVSSKMKDTCTVMVERYVQHPKYKKFIRHSKKFLVHDPGNSAAIGQKVEIKETRPISKRKRFALVRKNEA